MEQVIRLDGPRQLRQVLNREWNVEPCDGPSQQCGDIRVFVVLDLVIGLSHLFVGARAFPFRRGDE